MILGSLRIKNIAGTSQNIIIAVESSSHCERGVKSKVINGQGFLAYMSLYLYVNTTHIKGCRSQQNQCAQHVFAFSPSLSIYVSQSCSVNVQNRWPSSNNIMITMATKLSERHLLCTGHSSSNQSDILTGADTKEWGMAVKEEKTRLRGVYVGSMF